MRERGSIHEMRKKSQISHESEYGIYHMQHGKFIAQTDCESLQ